jgi:hypothetical protein
MVTDSVTSKGKGGMVSGCRKVRLLINLAYLQTL